MARIVRIGLGALLTALAVVLQSSSLSAAEPRTAGITWEVTQEQQFGTLVSFGIRNPDGHFPYRVRYELKGPYGAKETQFVDSRDDQLAEAVFPDDFIMTPVSGRYRWVARVAGRVEARGQFTYTKTPYAGQKK